MVKKIAAGLVCFTLIALGITSCQNHLFAKDSGEVGTYQLVSDQNRGNIKFYKINTTNGDTWMLIKGKWYGTLPHKPFPEELK